MFRMYMSKLDKTRFVIQNPEITTPKFYFPIIPPSHPKTCRKSLEKNRKNLLYSNLFCDFCKLLTN